MTKPQLVVHDGDLPATTIALRDLLAATGLLYDRGRTLVKLEHDVGTRELYARPISVSGIVMLAHQVAEPVKMSQQGSARSVTLPERVARMYLELGNWGVEPLAGVTTSPILRDNGAIVASRGYDKETQVYVDALPEFSILDRPTRQDAEHSLLTLRTAFRTFPFADAVMIRKGDLAIVDGSVPPGLDETGFLATILTAVCRASLWLAPGVLVAAPTQSGSGSGKGLLLKGASLIAFGRVPPAQTGGHDRQEFEKRLVTDLVEGRPFIMLDNINGTTLRCDALASALTERPSHVRVLGRTGNADINSAALIGLTGNGLVVSEDLARRMLQVNINPRVEDPELRKFDPGFLDGIRRQRADLLGPALTIWRWGRQNASSLKKGLPCGSFEVWAEWVRDPLLTLGCADAVDGMRMAKHRDPMRQEMAELFATWNRCHADDVVTYKDLNPDVIKLLCPHKQTDHAVRTALEKLSNTRGAGFVLTRDKPGKWVPATYRLQQSCTSDPSPPSTNLKSGAWEKNQASETAPAMLSAAPGPQVRNGTGGTEVTGTEGDAHHPQQRRSMQELLRDPATRRKRATEIAKRAYASRCQDK